MSCGKGVWWVPVIFGFPFPFVLPFPFAFPFGVPATVAGSAFGAVPPFMFGLAPAVI